MHTLISLQQSSQATAALSFIGQSVVLDGSTTQMKNQSATGNLNVSKSATATVTIQDANG